MDPASLARSRQFAFEPTPAVIASRARKSYVACPVCQTDGAEYLFHKVGVRFVRCRMCGTVYANPIGDVRPSYFDVAATDQYRTLADRRLAADDFRLLLERIEQTYSKARGSAPHGFVLAGRWLDSFADSDIARSLGLRIARVDQAAFTRLALDADIEWMHEALRPAPAVVLLNELLEACSDPGEVVGRISQRVDPETWLAVSYSNALSMPATLLRRYWAPFFGKKTTYFGISNLTALMARHGYYIVTEFPMPTRHTADYVLRRLAPDSPLANAVLTTPIGQLAAPIRTGNYVAIFQKRPAPAAEKVSIVLPVFNEARYVGAVIDAILDKQLRIEKELIIVESNSTDGTREIVKKYQGRPGVKLVLEDKPRGKGHAVRAGLAVMSGTIVLIQDADFEYDIHDYDALLEPILQRRASFVLGSRTLGLDDWKVRQFHGNPLKRVLLNTGQLIFASTFNLLYQKRTTDVNTMFKVFRAECLQGLDLESNRFDFDIELVCKLVMNGNAPLEVPVNYVARGFAEGKKISFVRDAIPSYLALLRYRFRH